MYIILTVPHCIALNDTDERTSDRNALNMANIFSTNAKKSINKIHTIIIKSNQNRQILDDNRYSNYSTNLYNKLTIKKDSMLWTRLRKIIGELHYYSLYQINKLKYVLQDKPPNNDMVHRMKMYEKNNIIIIDMHSFPSGGFGQFPDKQLEYKIVIIDYLPYQSITQYIARALNDKGIMTSLREGEIGKNSILDVFSLHPVSIPIILFEVREDLNELELGIIANILIELLMEWNNKNTNHSKIIIKPTKYILNN
jgi:hypothetical protein